MEEKMIEEIKYHIRYSKEFEDEVILLTNNGLKVNKDELLQQKVSAYIKKRGGIQNIVNARNRLDTEFEFVKDIFEKSRRMRFFNKKRTVTPVLKNFFDAVKELYDNYEYNWEYIDYFGMIQEFASEGTWYPFLNEIEHPATDTEPEIFLDNLIRQVRKDVCYREYSKSYFFYCKCMACQESLNKKLEGNKEVLNKSFDTQDDFGLPVCQHVFNLVKIGDRRFILDPTFVQFCDLQETIDIVGVPGIAGALPGHYLMNTPEQIELLHSLVRNGYFEVTEENLKMYMDCFILANRNIEFYKNHPDMSRTETEFEYKDYIALLLGRKKLDIGKPNEIGSFKGEGYEKNKNSR